MKQRQHLTKYAIFSIVTAVLTMLLKAGAYQLTDSVSLLSDALESGINLVAAVVAWIVLSIAALPPDDEHLYGHDKVEYFAAGVEGALVVIAAFAIAFTAVRRLLQPMPLMQLDIGLMVSVAAGCLNLFTARILLRAGHKHRSVTLRADGQHLMADVWTSAAVVLGLLLVRFTGWAILDPVLALLVAIHVLYAGYGLVRESVYGLMDTVLPAEELAIIEAILNQHAQENVQYHALRSRQSGAQRFLSVHIQVPGIWSVQQGHTFVEEIEKELVRALAPISVITHLEPIEDPRSWDDIALNREEAELN